MRARPVIHPFFDEPTNTVTYIVADPTTMRAAVIDPVLDYDPSAGAVDTRSVHSVMQSADKQGYVIVWTLETHAHADHMGGMAAVLANFHPRELWLGVNSPAAELQVLLRTARVLGIPVVEHKAGDALEIGGAAIRVLAPAPDLDATTTRPNDESLVMKIAYGQTSALLEGDAEKRTEKQVAEEKPQADLLKVAHHGSATSTIPELLAAVHPQFAVISVGARNVYGHPRIEVLQRLADSKVPTYRTDLDGAVTFYLDGQRVTPELEALH